jgi:hypothetical protein
VFDGAFATPEPGRVYVDFDRIFQRWRTQVLYAEGEMPLAITMISEARLFHLGFSEGLVEHFRNFDKASPLGFRCQPPLHCFSSPIMQRSIEPIRECGTTLVYFSWERQRLEKCSLENIDDIWDSYPSAQCALAALFIELFEDDTPEETLRSIASELSFVHIERLISEAIDNQGASYESWKTSFPLTCNG